VGDGVRDVLGLYLSHRTVGNKLFAAYAKLGVEGRSQLAKALEAF
jgi:DNA-binding CsgD family transcriptional regulator